MLDTFWAWALGDLKNDDDYYEEEDLEWVTGVLPLVAFRDLTLPADDAGPKWSKYQDSKPVNDCYRISYLIDHLHTYDPFGETPAYRALNDVDPGFKKLWAFSQVYKRSMAEDRGVYPLDEWKDPKYLLYWVVANAHTRLKRLPDLVAEEAANTMMNTRYLKYYMMFFHHNKSLGEIRAQRLRDNEPECWFQSPLFFQFR